MSGRFDYSADWARLRHGDRNVGDLMNPADAVLYQVECAGKGRLVPEPGLGAS